MLIQNSRTKQHVGPPPIRFLCPSRTFFRQKPSCTKTHEPKQNVDSPKPREPGPSTTLYYRDSNPIPRPQAPVLLCTTATRFQGSGPRPQYYCVYDRSPIPRPVSGVAPGPVLLSATATQFQELAPHDWGLGLQARLLLCTTETQSAEPFWASSDIFCSQAASLLLLHYIAQCTDGKLFLDFALAVYSGLNWCGLEDLLSAASPPL